MLPGTQIFSFVICVQCCWHFSVAWTFAWRNNPGFRATCNMPGAISRVRSLLSGSCDATVHGLPLATTTLILQSRLLSKICIPYVCALIHVQSTQMHCNAPKQTLTEALKSNKTMFQVFENWERIGLRNHKLSGSVSKPVSL